MLCCPCLHFQLLLHLHSWSRKLITKASKTQFLDLPSVNLQYLRERGVAIRCSDFSVGALRSSQKQSSHTLPVLTSDKATFNIPNDVHNPALQVGISLYFYPAKFGNKFLGEFLFTFCLPSLTLCVCVCVCVCACANMQFLDLIFWHT